LAVRIPLALIGVISFGIGITLLVEGKYHPMIVYLAVAAVVAIVGVFLERQGYFGSLPSLRRAPDPDAPSWTRDYYTDQKTGERVEIRYNPITGEQRYVDESDGKARK